MARARLDPQIVAHLEWIGFIQPTGLVVSAPALVRAGAILDRRDAEGQRLLRQSAEAQEFDPKAGAEPWLPDFKAFASSVLGWSFSAKAYAGTDESPIPSELEVVLPDYGDTLRPDFAVREMEPLDGETPWQLLVSVLDPGQDFDRVAASKGKLDASPHGRMERLLRRTGVSAGLIFNGRSLRLISAPRGESSGWMDFRVADMAQTAGRPICTALRLLLGQSRLLALPRPQRLPALLEDSRLYQNEVSERLAEQVLHALYELQRGLQAAHDASKGELLRQPLSEHPDDVYRALLTVILRLVFLLYSEERDMLPKDDTFLQHYSLAGLYERLREDAALFPDTMDQRYGAWAQLLVLFRLIYDGAEAGTMRLPRRHGVLFDPDRFKFLEGRSGDGARQIHERIEPPLVPDGTIYRALEKLLVLDGERISYRALDVEQIGSVYETMMGFRLETATGPSVAIRSPKKHGAPAAIDLQALLAEPTTKRTKWIKERTDRKLTAKVQSAAKQAATLEDLHAALLPVIDLAASPDLVPKGAMILQPSEERRRSGSHYTPRTLTEPIVRTTLEPILARLRDDDDHPPRPKEILDLKICDPAMGSGAFLVEACRQLGDALVVAWHAHGEVQAIPPDEDEVVFARRLIAQRCLYGVDRNPVAVDLAKVSLWLVTLAKDHALTFVDHALRHGDSLVGLSQSQIEAFHWDTSVTWESPFKARMREQLQVVSDLRQRIRDAGEGVSDWELRDLWDEVQFELGKVRLFGDLVIAAFFDGDRPKARERNRSEYISAVVRGEAESYGALLEGRRHADPPLAPFHWGIEFPEVFGRAQPGFDATIGNPPFLGGRNISGTLGKSYLSWLFASTDGAAGQTDLVAYFFRRAYERLAPGGALGLIATNTIAQGDTRRSGLACICRSGGEIYRARRRVPWPGIAAVIVSVVHIGKELPIQTCTLDKRPVGKITAFLLHHGPSDDPPALAANAGLAFKGQEPYGKGFQFDDGEPAASPLSLAQHLVQTNPRNEERIRPYLGGSEILNHPAHQHRRYVIYFGEMGEDEAAEWPELLSICREKVARERASKDKAVASWPYWRFWRTRPALCSAKEGLARMLAHPFTSAHLAFAFVPATTVVASPHIVVALATYAAFSTLQSRIHEVWARLTSSTFKDDLSYKVSDSFDTFPFPADWTTHPALENAGQAYYEFRAALMVKNDEGLTKTYNRFHDPEERDTEILKLRELHAAMDRAVLDACAWSDIPIDCEFLLDYEIDEENWSPRRRRPWRYRWRDEVRDEVLARLLELNAERAKEEVRSGAAAQNKKPGRKKAGKRKRKDTGTGDLFS